MNDNAKKWLEALRSDEYVQGQRRLRTRDDQFCCLGVACEISGLGLWEADGLGEYRFTPADDTLDVGSGILPHAVRDWLGLQTNDGRFRDPENGHTNWLITKNDQGLPFKDIADLIESEPEGLFT